MKKFNIPARMKNPFFWVGVVGVVLTAAGISPESLVTWDILFENILAIGKNPAMLGAVFVALLGVWVDGSTPGFTDKH